MDARARLETARGIGASSFTRMVAPLPGGRSSGRRRQLRSSKSGVSPTFVSRWSGRSRHGYSRCPPSCVRSQRSTGEWTYRSESMPSETFMISFFFFFPSHHGCIGGIARAHSFRLRCQLSAAPHHRAKAVAVTGFTVFNNMPCSSRPMMVRMRTTLAQFGILHQKPETRSR